ncbi:hypothetical protein SAMN05660297_02735 [Natronincola peptidivorans]|uniref:Uncharacterized protein n=1 Tax=Natronincola peptidivorans TaxID=426128 RepID=A0A1I0FD13_9FIRM|nr:hypothetical protein [Natronincola peptidivorans]SET55243.1 hypothetical protein SAMN05660297_02735 [Natronincola peptidivorans]
MANFLPIADKLTLDEIKTHLTNNLNTTVSSRADQTTVNAIKTKTDLVGVANPTANTTTVMGYLRRNYDAITTGGGIKLVQRGTTSVAGVSQVDVTLSTVVVSKTFCVLLTWQNADYSSSSGFYIQLLNSNTLRVSKTVMNAVNVTWEVVEFS